MNWFLSPRGDKNQWGDKQEMPDHYVKVLHLLRDNPNATKPQMAKELHVGKSTIDKAMEHLNNKGLIERMGSNKSGYWKAKDESFGNWMGKTNTIIRLWPWSEFLSSIEFINAYGLHGVLMKGFLFTRCTVSPTGLSKTNFIPLTIFGTCF